MEGYSVVDLFCGIGGLSHGLIKEGFVVKAGIDVDNSCRFAFEANNNGATFLAEDITTFPSSEIEKLFGGDKKILVGCAPCQPFSTYAYKSDDKEKWRLLYRFGEVISDLRPEIVSMENVPRLLNFKKEPVFKDFTDTLESLGYYVSHQIVNCPDYGIPQRRKRLVLLASRLGEISLIEPTHTKEQYVTVRDTISHMEPLESGQASSTDPVHRAAKLSEKNLRRIRQSKPNGSWKDWEDDLKLDCHVKDTGKTYVSVYGRMSWDEPAPTMTTHCIGIGNGRFGHPKQDRAISLREAALFQTFPESYSFYSKDSPLPVRKVATHIGNAVPVQLGEVIGKSILRHLEKYKNGKDEKGKNF